LFAYIWAQKSGLRQTAPNAFLFIRALYRIDFGLLIFNMLPIYPLDGGQILRSLLWFMMGKARSLFVATSAGMGGVLLLVLVAIVIHSPWTGIIAAFVLLNCWTGLKYARALTKLNKLPKHTNFACPSCKTSPPMATIWLCNNCRRPFDTFAHNATCPNCAAQFATTKCVECRESAPIAEWTLQPLPPPIPI
jgi:predicted RNA-binding Zn-ribbon protein involved in translation (DUF1610 family)